jgi:hypothetical protein
MSSFTKILKAAAVAGLAAYTANKINVKNQKWAFQCSNSKCRHYEERSINSYAKCPSCGWNFRGRKIT